MNNKNVFISMGTPYNPTQAKCRASLIGLLEDCGVTPRVIDVTDYSTGNPLTDICNILRQCDGAIVMAYERTFVDTGSEKRKSPAEKQLNGARYTTPWNQIEAAIAHSMGLPILVLVEDGVTKEGLLEPKYDWHVEKLEDISARTFANKDVRARVRAWCKKIQANKKTRSSQSPIDAHSMTLSDAMQLITLRTGAYLAIAIFFVFSSGMAAVPILNQVRAKLGL